MITVVPINVTNNEFGSPCDFSGDIKDYIAINKGRHGEQFQLDDNFAKQVGFVSIPPSSGVYTIKDSSGNIEKAILVEDHDCIDDQASKKEEWS